MISVDLHLRDCTATVETYAADAVSGGFITIKVEGPGQYVSIFGKPENTEKFEKIAALLNECFVKPAASPAYAAPSHVETPADLAGDYLGTL